MNPYQTEITKIKKRLWSNQGQLDTVIGVRRHIEKHYDQKLHLEALARLGFVSKYHLLRLFKRYYGQTPKQYLTDIRIKKAKAHLKDGMPVTETCFAVGFESLGSFSTLFKHRTGLTPREFQKKAQL